MDLSLTGEQLPLSSFFVQGSQCRKSLKAKRKIGRVSEPEDGPPRKREKQKEIQKPIIPIGIRPKGKENLSAHRSGRKGTAQTQRLVVDKVQVQSPLCSPLEDLIDLTEDDPPDEATARDNATSQRLSRAAGRSNARLFTPVDKSKSKSRDAGISLLLTPPPTSMRPRRKGVPATVRNVLPATQKPRSTASVSSTAHNVLPLTPETPTSRVRHLPGPSEHTPPFSSPSGATSSHTWDTQEYVPTSCPQSEASMTLSQALQSQSACGQFPFSCALGSNRPSSDSGVSRVSNVSPNASLRVPSTRDHHAEDLRSGDELQTSSHSQYSIVPSSQTQELTISDEFDVGVSYSSTSSRSSRPTGRTPAGDEVVPTSQSQERELEFVPARRMEAPRSPRDEIIPSSQRSEREMEMNTLPRRVSGPRLMALDDSQRSNTHGLPADKSAGPIVESSELVQSSQSQLEDDLVDFSRPRTDSRLAQLSKEGEVPYHDKESGPTPAPMAPSINLLPQPAEDEQKRDQIVGEVPHPRSPVVETQASYGLDSQLFTSPLQPPTSWGTSSLGSDEDMSPMPTQVRIFRDMFTGTPEGEGEHNTQPSPDQSENANEPLFRARRAEQLPQRMQEDDSETESESEPEDIPRDVSSAKQSVVAIDQARPPSFVAATSLVPTRPSSSPVASSSMKPPSSLPSPHKDVCVESTNEDGSMLGRDSLDISEGSQDHLDTGPSSFGSSQGSSLPSAAIDFMDMFSQPGR